MEKARKLAALRTQRSIKYIKSCIMPVDFCTSPGPLESLARRPKENAQGEELKRKREHK